MSYQNDQRLQRLDHLRVFGCILSLLYTSTIWIPNSDIYSPYLLVKFLGYIQKFSFLGTEIFFVLSAFWFTVLIQDQKIIYYKFLYNRILSIFPIFFLVISIWYIFHYSESLIQKIDSWFGILFSFSNSKHPYFMAPIWRVGIEFQFYLIFPLLLHAFQKKRQILFWILGLIIAMKIIFVLNNNVDSIGYYSWLGHLEYFLVGMIIGDMYIKGSFSFLEKKYAGNSFFFLSLFISFGLLFLLYSYQKNQLLIIFRGIIQSSISAMIIIGYLYSSIFSNPKINQILIYLSDFAYSIYFLHVLIGTFLVKYIGKYFHHGLLMPWLYTFLVLLPISFFLAFLINKLFEYFFPPAEINYFQ